MDFIHRVALTGKWVEAFMKRLLLPADRCIFYTYWLDYGSLGIGLLKRTHPSMVLVSRAHNIDIYEWRSPHSYLPCQRETVGVLDGLFPDSEAGTRYLAERYPALAPRMETARMAVPDPGFVTRQSDDGVFRIDSCSFLVPVKRVDLLLRGVARAAEMRPERTFEWRHFGKGPLKETIEREARRILPPNARSSFPGYPSLKHLMRHYRDDPVDVFVNVSEIEGTPVSLMEAASCGIPLLATSVGGNPEIVTEDNGRLLSPHPTPAEIASALLFFLDHPEILAAKRKGSVNVWRDRYDADKNMRLFAERLKELRGTKREGPST